ncbi:hypothetical protein L1049_018555 [Liquidambar formosana]|uniref:Nuclease HARBI1 n=1 Tax=Liquidambar formosana TaxID=63359 RepID=A0AAP0WNE1_LIQFO
MDITDQLDEFVDEWDRRRRIAAQLVAYLVYYYRICKHANTVDRMIMPNDQIKDRERRRNELMYDIRTSESSRGLIRMSPEAFETLCNILQTSGRLTATRRATIEEQVSKFLYMLGHNVRNRVTSFFFYRSLETTSRHYHCVLRAIISLEDQFLKQPNRSEVPPQILHSSRFFPYFKDCIGALDGTHVRVKVSPIDAPRYRGRKDYPTQNVLAACSFDLRFTYVLPGWEGTASDSRIIKNALTREDNLQIPEGKYYLVDAGYMLKSSLLPPYKGIRYHLKEYSTRAPENARELFNHGHASLRNAIERCFGVLKKRFPIIGSMTDPTYSFDTQTEIILACCILHNFLMGVDPDENIIAEVDRELENGTQPREALRYRDNDDEDARRGAIIRDNIAAAMWNDYVLN